MEPSSALSQREQQVAGLLLQGKSNKEMAAALGISIRTVEFHLSHLFSKLGVSSRTEAVLKLTETGLRETAGDPAGETPVESTVDSQWHAPHNEAAIQSTRRIPLFKRPLFILLIVLITAVCLFLFLILWNFSPVRPRPISRAGAQQIALTPLEDSSLISTPTPAPTLTARQQNVAEAVRLAAEYDQAVQAELQKGSAEVSRHPVTGEEIVRFRGEANERIALLYDRFNQQIVTLNRQYEALYLLEVQPTPFPTRASAAENEAYYQQLVAQYPETFDEIFEAGPTIQIYDPDEGKVFNRLIGDSHARSEILTDAIEALRQAPLIAMVDQAAHIEHIRAVMEQPDLALTFEGVAGLANAHGVQAAEYVDDAGTKYSVALDANLLAGVQPGYRPEVPAVDVRPIEEVLLLAEQFARAHSPRYQEMKAGLAREQGGKGDIYFFTWRIPGRDWSGTDWAFMPPFLQIGMTADGKLATYINTLDLFEE